MIGIISRPTIHDLRHFAGTSAARLGNLRETMDQLGVDVAPETASA
jgi:hypothetical protein